MAEEPLEKKDVVDAKVKNVKTDDRKPASLQQERSRRSGGRTDRRFQQSGPNRSYQSRRRFHRRKVCAFCVDKTLVIDWKRVDNLRRFVADNGAIFPRRKSGVCARHQRRVAVAIKRARHIALLPYTSEHIRIMSKS